MIGWGPQPSSPRRMRRHARSPAPGAAKLPAGQTSARRGSHRRHAHSPAHDGSAPASAKSLTRQASARGGSHRRHGRLAATRTRRQLTPPRPTSRPGRLRTRQPPSPPRQTRRHPHATATHPATANLPTRQTPHATAAIAATTDSPPPARHGNSPRHGQPPDPADSARDSRHRRHDRLAATRTPRQPAPPRPLRTRQPPSPSRQTHRHAHAATARLPRRASVSRRLPARGSRHPADSPRTGPANATAVSRADCVSLAVRQVPRTRQQPSRRRLVVRQTPVGARELPVDSSADDTRRGIGPRAQAPANSQHVAPCGSSEATPTARRRVSRYRCHGGGPALGALKGAVRASPDAVAGQPPER